jgi:hypothetical protein
MGRHRATAAPSPNRLDSEALNLYFTDKLFNE